MNEKTVNVAGREVPLDDSSTRTVYADLTIEENVADGMVHIGLGHLVGWGGIDKVGVIGAVRLRVTPEMAERLAAVLVRLAALARSQREKRHFRSRTSGHTHQ